MSQYFPKPYEPFGETLMSTLTDLIMQQKPIEKMRHMLMLVALHQNQI